MKDFEQRVLERMPSPEEERASLGRVWNQVERAGGRIPDDVLRSVQPRLPHRYQRAWTLLPKAIAAVLVLGVAIGTAIVWPRGVRVYAAGNDGLQVTLADDSRVEMRAHSELTVDEASDGIRIDLKKGDIIVTAARQRDGRLYVRTNDMTVAVEGTVFLANAGQQGSRVAVIEGEVRVTEGDVERRLRPGEQVATSPTIAQRPLAEDITWSRNADAHRAILDSFRRGIAQTSGPLGPVVPAVERQRGTGPAAPAAVEFEEASIRECDPDNLPPTLPGARGGGPNSFFMTPGRTHVLCMTLATIIRTAYGLGAAGNEYVNDGSRARPVRLNAVAGLGVENGTMVRGGPDWVRSDRYTIEATADPSADAEAMSRPMLRALLERRFRLKAHIEEEPIPAFTLSVSKGGLKMKAAQPGDCEELKPVPGQPTIARTLAEVKAGAKPNCGIYTERDGQKVVYAGYAAPMNGPALGGLVQRLALRLDRTRVIDKTGLTGAYTFVLQFFQDEATPPSEVWRASTLGAALEEQLGLTLEPTTAPREFIVIDAVERPSAN
jgi:uncharacterized protein (TIGR03435 family)